MTEQQKREAKIARLNKQGLFHEALELYLDARGPRQEVWEAFYGLVRYAGLLTKKMRMRERETI